MATTTKKTKPVFTEDELREIREKVEAIKAEADAPLPGGDEGLIEAERRLLALKPRFWQLHREVNRGDVERETAAEDHLQPGKDAIDELAEHIDETAPLSLAGMKVKMRRLLDDTGLQSYDDFLSRSLRQIGDFVERGGAVPSPAGLTISNSGTWRATITTCLALRRLHRYAQARVDAEELGADVSHLPATPLYPEIEDAYLRLLEPMLDEGISNASQAVAAAEALGVILADLWTSEIIGEGAIVSTERDYGDMLRLIGDLRRWTNSVDCRERVGKALSGAPGAR